jgi:hypothetical protein
VQVGREEKFSFRRSMGMAILFPVEEIPVLDTVSVI